MILIFIKHSCRLNSYHKYSMVQNLNVKLKMYRIIFILYYNVFQVIQQNIFRKHFKWKKESENKIPKVSLLRNGDMYYIRKTLISFYHIM